MSSNDTDVSASVLSSDPLVNIPRMALRLILACNIALVVLMFVLSYHNRLTSDDFCYLWHLREYGYWGACLHWWNTWTGRFVQTVLETAIVGDSRFHLLLIYNIANIALFVAGLWFVLRQAAKIYLQTDFRSGQVLQLALLATGIIYFCTAQKDQDWMWLGGTIPYLMPFPILLIAGGLLMPQRSSVGRKVAASLLFALLPLLTDITILTVPVILFALSCWEAWRVRKEGGSAWRSFYSYKAFPPLLAFVVSELIQFTSPGVHLRMSKQHSAVNLHVLKLLAQDMFRVFLHLLHNFHWLLLILKFRQLRESFWEGAPPSWACTWS